MGVVLQGLFYFVGEGDTVLMLILAGLSGIPLSVAYVSVWTMLPDVCGAI